MSESPTFRDHLLCAGLADGTIRNYIQVVERAESWCLPRGHKLASISPTHLRALADDWAGGRSSKKLLQAALGRFWEHVERSNPPTGAIRVPRRTQGMCRALEPDDAVILAKAARAHGGREGLAVAIGLYQGLRRAEIASLTWRALDLASGWLTVCGKGDKTGRLPIHANVDVLMRAKPANDSLYLFPSPKGGPVTPTCIWLWVRKVADEAGVGQVACHRLRHSSIATIVDVSGDLRGAQTFARHSDPRVTAGYSRTKDARLVELVALLDY